MDTAIQARSTTANTGKCSRARGESKAAGIPAALTNFDSLPDSANVRIPVVAALYACSKANVWRLVKSKRIPSPRKVSERCTVWNVGELRTALAGIRGAGA